MKMTSNATEVIARRTARARGVGTAGLKAGTQRVVEEARAGWPVDSGRSAASLGTVETPDGASVVGSAYIPWINNGTTQTLLLELPLRALGPEIVDAVRRDG